MKTPLKKVIFLLSKAKKEKKLGLFALINDDVEIIKMIAEQAQGIMSNGERYNNNAMNMTAYYNTSNQFGEKLVKAAIKWYNSLM